MIELLVTITIAAVLSVAAIVFVGMYVNWSQQTANQETLATLNSSLQHYKTLGGMTNAHSLQGYNTQYKINAVVNSLMTGFTVYNSRKSFVNTGAYIDTSKFYVSGQGRSFCFTGMGTSQGGATSSSFAGTYTARDTPAAKFVAVAANSNAAAYSADGITWTASTLPSSASWYGVTYGNGKFVAVAYGSNTAAYSSDGITWTASALPSNTTWYSVAYGNGKFVAVAQGGTAAAYSTDGINWTASTLPSSASLYCVTYGNGKFVAVAYNSTAAAYSADGITWTASTLASNVGWRSVTYGE